MSEGKIKRGRYMKYAALILIIITISSLTFYYLLRQEVREVATLEGVVKVAVATIDDKGLEDQVSPTFTDTKKFTIFEIESGKVKNMKVIKNPAANLTFGRGPIVAQLLANEGVNIVVASEFGPGISAMLDDKKIKRIVAEPGKKVMDVFIEKAFIK